MVMTEPSTLQFSKAKTLCARPRPKQLDTAVKKKPIGSSNQSPKLRNLSSNASQTPSRRISSSGSGKWADYRVLKGGADVIMFDFDGTLTSKPGHILKREFEIKDLCERAPMLKLHLEQLQKAGILLGIISKSPGRKIKHALKEANLNHLFDGPVIGDVTDILGKAGVIQDHCTLPHGSLNHIGSEKLHRVVLVDDDLYQLSLAHDCGIQAFSAPPTGGLQAKDFDLLCIALGLHSPPSPDQRLRNFSEESDTHEITHVCTRGLVGKSLGLSTDKSKHVLECPMTIADFYEIEENSIGKGSFGICFPGQHKESSTHCIVKRVTLAGAHPRDLAQCSDKNQNCKFGHMLKIMNDHSHPNVIRYFDFLFGPEYRYTIMERLNGKELFEYLVEKVPVTESFCQKVMQQLLSALDHTHTSMGLIHRDVKPENLRFRTDSPDSELVLLDFGLSTRAATTTNDCISEKQDVVGTLLYVAPEVFGQKYTTQVDLWSSGVVFYILLTGNPPWKLNKNSGFRLSEDIMDGRAVEIALDRLRCQGIPLLAVDLLRGLLETSPDRRLKAADALDHRWLKKEIRTVSYSFLSETCSTESIQRASSLQCLNSTLGGSKFGYGMTRLQSAMAACTKHTDPEIRDSRVRELGLKDIFTELMKPSPEQLLGGTMPGA